MNIDIIINEYTTSCLYVHGNQNADMRLAEIYQNCFEDKEIDNLAQKLNVLVKLLKELFECATCPLREDTLNQKILKNQI